MTRGVFYGVGVGPGDPELMTLKAVNTVRRCPVVAAPRTRGGMVALDIARGAVDMAGKTIVPLDFAMSHDPEERRRSHLESAALLRRHLDNGNDVAMLNLGDVSIYASYRYLADILSGEGYETGMIPGVTSFCAAAAVLGTSLTDMDSVLHIIPEAGDVPDAVLAGNNVAVCMKSGRKLPGLLEQLKARGLLDRAMLVQNCGLPDERIYRSLDDIRVESDYFSLVIIKNAPGETA